MSIEIGIIYFALSALLNVLITVLIAWRLLSYRRNFRRALGPDQSSSTPYTTIAAMVTESSLLYTVFLLLFIIPYGAKSHVSDIFLPTLSQVVIIAPMLINLRVARRQAWDSQMDADPPTKIRFIPSATRNMGSTDVTDNQELVSAQPVHLRPERSGSFSSLDRSDVSGYKAKN